MLDVSVLARVAMATASGAEIYIGRQEQRHRALPYNPSRRGSLSAQEQGYLGWFTCRASVKLPGLFGSHFWDTLVLQSHDSEQAVLNAVLALGCAYGAQCYPGEPNNECFILSHYNKAIITWSRRVCSITVGNKHGWS